MVHNVYNVQKIALEKQKTFTQIREITPGSSWGIANAYPFGLEAAYAQVDTARECNPGPFCQSRDFGIEFA